MTNGWAEVLIRFFWCSRPEGRLEWIYPIIRCISDWRQDCPSPALRDESSPPGDGDFVRPPQACEPTLRSTLLGLARGRRAKR